MCIDGGWTTCPIIVAMAKVKYTRDGEERWAFDRPHVDEIMRARGFTRSRAKDAVRETVVVPDEADTATSKEQ